MRTNGTRVQSCSTCMEYCGEWGYAIFIPILECAYCMEYRGTATILVANAATDATCQPQWDFLLWHSGGTQPWPSAFEAVSSLCQALLCHEVRLGPSGPSSATCLLLLPYSILYNLLVSHPSSTLCVVSRPLWIVFDNLDTSPHPKPSHLRLHRRTGTGYSPHWHKSPGTGTLVLDYNCGDT
jgi:hypothetical protein